MSCTSKGYFLLASTEHRIAAAQAPHSRQYSVTTHYLMGKLRSGGWEDGAWAERTIVHGHALARTPKSSWDARQACV